MTVIKTESYDIVSWVCIPESLIPHTLSLLRATKKLLYSVGFTHIPFHTERLITIDQIPDFLEIKHEVELELHE